MDVSINQNLNVIELKLLNVMILSTNVIFVVVVVRDGDDQFTELFSDMSVNCCTLKLCVYLDEHRRMFIYDNLSDQ